MLRNFLHCTHAPKIRFARRLRRKQTSGEQKLWRYLRSKRFHHLKFRRQVPVGPYIVDFLCVEKKLVIEIDGEAHFQPDAERKDRKRENFLRAQGLEVLRFNNGSVMEDCDAVLTCMAEKMGCYREIKSPLPGPLPLGEGRPRVSS
jgi:very-short-patch-repair endonuclease